MNQKKWKMEWDLSVLYKSPKDPIIEKDVAELEKALIQFAKKYTKDKAYLSNAKALRKLLDEEEAISLLPGSNKPLRYLHLLKDAGKATPDVDKQINLISERLKKADNQSIGIWIALGKIPVATQKKLLTATELAPFKYRLEIFFTNAKYQLTEAEEKIMSLKSGPARDMWVSGLEKAISKKKVRFKGKSLPLPEAQAIVYELPIKKRHQLYDAIMEQALTLADYAEGELNAIITNKKIGDELRGHQEPYETRFLGDEVRPQDIIPFAKVVTDHFYIAQRFYKLKKKLLKLNSLAYVDRGAKIGTIKKSFTFTEAATLLYETLHKVKPEFATHFEQMLINGQIDVLPRQGKHGGAYSWKGTTVPNVMFLNHVSNFQSLTTLAHETGHEIHSHLAQTHQPHHYQDYSTAVAETASTFFENFIFDAILPTLSKKEQIVALHDKINDSISSIFRQIAAFNFEVELHNKIRTEGFAEHEEIAALMQKHLGAYLGPAFKLTKKDGYAFILWSHFRRFFYVYSYAYGELISDALYERYKADPKSLEQTLEIFKAGSSLPPHLIFKKAGIDTTKTDFFTLGLKKIEADIAKLEKLTA